jgi:CHASE3 domain sensor protein
MFNNMTIKSRLVFVMSLLLLLLMGIGSLGVVGVKQTNDSIGSVYVENTVPLGDLILVGDRMQRVHLDTEMVAYARSAGMVKEWQAVNDQQDAEIAAIWQKYRATALTPEEASLTENFNRQWKTYVESRNRTMALAAAGDHAAAIANSASDATPKFDTVHATLFKLLELQRDEAARKYAEAQNDYQSIFMTMATMIALGILLAVMARFLLVRAFITPPEACRT